MPVPIKMSGEPPRKKTKLGIDLEKRNRQNAAIRSAREDFDPPFQVDDPVEEEEEEQEQGGEGDNDDEEREHETDQAYETDQGAEGDLETAPVSEVSEKAKRRATRAETKANTRQNTGYTSLYGQVTAISTLTRIRRRPGLHIIAPRGQQDQPATTATQQGHAQAFAAFVQEFQQQGRSHAYTPVEYIDPAL